MPAPRSSRPGPPRERCSVRSPSSSSVSPCAGCWPTEPAGRPSPRVPAVTLLRSGHRSSAEERPVPVAVTGSIATDHLMTFPGKFVEQFVEGQMENVSLSFLVDDLVQHRGGAGANMAYGLGLLGLEPVLIGAVGSDFADYEAWLRRHGVDTKSVHWSELKHTARFVCTTDTANNQIASFYSGAMAEAAEIELSPIEARVGGLDLVVIAPNDPTAMV